MARPKTLQSNWNKGLNAERRLARKLRNKGLYVVRSAGSRGAADLVVIDKENRKVKLLQLKRSSKTNDGLKELEILKELEGTYEVIAELA